MVKGVLMRLRAPKPAVDAFNDAKYKVCEKSWGKTAWAENWAFDKV